VIVLGLVFWSLARSGRGGGRGEARHAGLGAPDHRVTPGGCRSLQRMCALLP
jgi:hypothetical protein